MTYDQAIDISLRPWNYNTQERWEALVVLQIFRATSTDRSVRQDASDAVDRLVWWGKD